MVLVMQMICWSNQKITRVLNDCFEVINFLEILSCVKLTYHYVCISKSRGGAVW